MRVETAAAAMSALLLRERMHLDPLVTYILFLKKT